MPPTFASDSSPSGYSHNEAAPPASEAPGLADQQDSPLLTDDGTPAAIQKALAELAGRRRQVAELEALGKLKDERIAQFEELIRSLEVQVATWKQAAMERATANVLDVKLEASFKDSLKAFDAELERVRKDRDKQAAQKKWYAVGGALMGALVVLGVLAAGKD